MEYRVIDTNIITVYWWGGRSKILSHWFVNWGHVHLGRLEIFLRTWPIRLFFNRILWKLGKKPVFCWQCGNRDELIILLRHAMVEAGIGLDRLDEMMGEPACVLDVASDYFSGLTDARTGPGYDDEAGRRAVVVRQGKIKE